MRVLKKVTYFLAPLPTAYFKETIKKEQIIWLFPKKAVILQIVTYTIRARCPTTIQKTIYKTNTK